MNKQAREEFILLFNQGFDEVVSPQIEELRENMEEIRGEMKHGFAEVKNRIGVLDSRLDSVERKVDRLVDQDFDTKATLQNHEKRIKKVEATRIAV